MAKDKHLKVKKELDRVQAEYAKYKEETEVRFEGIRGQNSVLQEKLS